MRASPAIRQPRQKPEESQQYTASAGPRMLARPGRQAPGQRLCCVSGQFPSLPTCLYSELPLSRHSSFPSRNSPAPIAWLREPNSTERLFDVLRSPMMCRHSGQFPGDFRQISSSGKWGSTKRSCASMYMCLHVC